MRKIKEFEWNLQFKGIRIFLAGIGTGKSPAKSLGKLDKSNTCLIPNAPPGCQAKKRLTKRVGLFTICPT
jgi:hypothetical protein